MVLFVHGGFHGAWCFAETLAALAREGMPCAAVDLTGHGGLTPPADFAARGAAQMAADVAEAAAALNGPVVLAGHSLGALAVMAAAERVRPVGMVLLAPAPPANITSVRLLPPFPADRFVAPPPPERAQRWFLTTSTDVDVAAYAARLCAESPAFLNDLYLRRVFVDPAWTRGPALCLSGGADDSALHPAGQDQAVAAFMGAELEVLPGAGHSFMLGESHKAMTARLLAWLHRNALAGKLPTDDRVAR